MPSGKGGNERGILTALHLAPNYPFPLQAYCPRRPPYDFAQFRLYLVLFNQVPIYGEIFFKLAEPKMISTFSAFANENRMSQTEWEMTTRGKSTATRQESCYARSS